MRIELVVDDVDAEECTDTPFTANLTVTTDDGRVVQHDEAGVGTTPRAAVEDLFRSAGADVHDVMLELFRSWKDEQGDGYVVVDGGLVQNAPGEPVFDLDVLDSDFVDNSTVEEAKDLRLRMIEHDPKALHEHIRAAEQFIANYGTPDQYDDLPCLDDDVEASEPVPAGSPSRGYDEKKVTRAREVLEGVYKGVAGKTSEVAAQLVRIEMATRVMEVAAEEPDLAFVEVVDWQEDVPEGAPFDVDLGQGYDAEGNHVVDAGGHQGAIQVEGHDVLDQLRASEEHGPRYPWDEGSHLSVAKCAAFLAGLDEVGTSTKEK